MEYSAVYAAKAIPAFSPVFIQPGETPGNSLYKHLPVVTIDTTDTLMGIAMNTIEANNMGTVLISGMARISSTMEQFNVHNKWITTKDKVHIVGSVVVETSEFDDDGETKVYVTMVMPWVNYLNVSVQITQVTLNTHANTFATKCIQKIVEDKQVTPDAIQNTLKVMFPDFIRELKRSIKLTHLDL